MSWTEKVSTRLAKRLQVAESPYSVGQISHGIEILMLYLFNATALLVSSYLLGVLTEALLLSSLYILHRMFTGGLHFKNPWTCLIAGVFTMVMGAFLLSKLPILGGYAYGIVLVFCAISFVINYRHAPAEHTYVSTDERIKQKSRRIIQNLLIIGCILSIILVRFGYTTLAITYALSALLQSLHLHPFSIRMVSRFEKLFERVD